MKIFSSLLTLALGIFLLTPAAMRAAEPTDTVTIFMIGDSTMADKPLNKEKQERGWGQLLPIYLRGAVKVENHAMNGRSSKSFINEGRWEKVRTSIRPGDYVIIQFGHNDEKFNNPKVYTEVGSTFDANLRKYVEETRTQGGIPILMNSIVRRNFPKNAKATVAVTGEDKQKTWKGTTNPDEEGTILVDTHGEYIIVPEKIAKETGTTFINMNKLTHELVQKLGPTLSRDLFMWIPAGVYEFCPEGKIDNTHLNVNGAVQISGIAAQALAAQVPGLRKYIRTEIYNLNSKQ